MVRHESTGDTDKKHLLIQLALSGNSKELSRLKQMIMDDGSNQGVLGDQGSGDDDVVCVCGCV